MFRIFPLLLGVAAAALAVAQDAPTTAPERIRVGGNVQAANLVKKVTPVYPPLAKQARVQGLVRFTVIIAKDGTIANMQLVSGHPLLVPAATEAVRQWQYRPTLLNGNPVEVITQIDVNFTLADDLVWAVNLNFLGHFSNLGMLRIDEEDRNKPARLRADGFLTGALSDRLRATPFRPLTLDGQPFEPTVWLSSQPQGNADMLPDVMAGWPQMEARLLARRDVMKPRPDIEGKYHADVIINREGNVEKLLRVSGAGNDGELIEAIRAAVADWKFRPVVINGEAFAVRTSIPIVF